MTTVSDMAILAAELAEKLIDRSESPREAIRVIGMLQCLVLRATEEKGDLRDLGVPSAHLSPASQAECHFITAQGYADMLTIVHAFDRRRSKAVVDEAKRVTLALVEMISPPSERAREPRDG